MIENKERTTEEEKTIIKKGEFVLVDYTGRLRETKEIFDTTIEEVAKKNDLVHEGHTFKPVYAVIGEAFSLPPGLNKQLEGKELEKEYTISLTAEEGFGKKNPRLLQLISLSKFKGQELMPVPGLQVSIDGLLGIVKTVTGGRVIVDFNHPLSGKELEYDVTVRKIITDEKEKLKILLEIQLELENPQIEVAENKAKVIVEKEIPKELAARFGIEAIKFLPTIRDIKFELPAPKEDKPLNISEK